MAGRLFYVHAGLPVPGVRYMAFPCSRFQGQRCHDYCRGRAEEPSYPQSSSNQSKSKMATSMINLVHRANFSRLLRPAVRLGQFYSTSTTPTVVDKQDKALEVIDEDGKVKNLN